MNFGGLGGGMGGPAIDPMEEVRDTAETIQISSLALLKMLLHGRAGVPLEVMGLMIGEQIDDYTIRVADVFSMPQTATGQSVEAVDPEYQVHMLDRLKLVGRHENVVGWYHSHPGFGCWLSSEDVMTASSYENLTPRSVSVVVDPIQSVRGKVVIDAFRTIPEQVLGAMATGRAPTGFAEPRQVTSNVGFLSKPTPTALQRGLDRRYYSLPITFRKKQHELRMLLNVYKKGWQEGFRLMDVTTFEKETRASIREIITLTKQAEKFITLGQDEDDLGNIGKTNALTHLQRETSAVINRNLNESIGTMINAVVF
ncbi:26S proteasome regulatory subunit N11 [Angomonas deanei]|nr:26S proteasome regulatory subunit N11 [Angomonas deanei]|eukprot:EPY24881.1 26S proteasome regulatory subunit N11 [Angomonas deanei]